MKLICGWENDTSRINKQCPFACTLSGLLLQGADYHNGILKESSPEASELCQAPAVTIGFVPRNDDEPYSEDRSIAIPTYFSNSREEFLMELRMPCEAGDQDRWIL